ncbi:MAG: hypothetical protein Ct9H90mP1_1520 [Methanobacteriota archaeon]|nr:MAG: hypothetical protein Ct9H90mP1_1520 [Euryarchaeota archaeon]
MGRRGYPISPLDAIWIQRFILPSEEDNSGVKGVRRTKGFMVDMEIERPRGLRSFT